MTQQTQEVSTAAVCSTADADRAGTDYRHDSRRSDGVFQRQLSAAGLEDVAERIAAGARLELEDAVVLSGTSLPLLGRIVELLPDRGCSTGFSRHSSDDESDDRPPEGGTMS